MRTTNTQKLEFGNSVMRVRTFTLFLIIFLLSCGTSFAAEDQPDYIAPNSKVDFDFNLQSSFQVQSLFEVADDVDVYRVVVPGNSYLDIETSGDADPYLRLYTQNETLLAFDKDNGAKSNSHIVYEVTAGTYFIVLDNRSDIDSFYTLKVTQRALGTLSDDVANNINPGSVITLNPQISPSVVINKAINYYGDADYFSFDLKQEGNIQFSLEASSFPIKFTLYDINYNLIREANASAAQKYLHDLAAGKYIIVIQGEEQVSANYSLSITHTGAVIDEDSDSIVNFVGKEITTIKDPQKNTYKKSIKSSIDYIGDVDIIKITVDEPGELFLMARPSNKRVKSSLAIQGRLYNYQGLELEADLAILDFNIERRVAAGTYYLAVFTDSKQLGKYRITSVLVYDRD
ncbi:MAG: pre-peptidase C-terminal domain-containing protein [Vampirovibrionia bacterium]